MPEEFEIAISNCDREPVHIPGRIQPFGALVGFDRKSGTIGYCSDNLSKFLGLDEETYLGRHFEDALTDRKFVHAIRGALGISTIEKQRERLGVWEIGGGNLESAMYACNGTAVVELERACDQSNHLASVAVVQNILAAVRQEQGPLALLRSAVAALRHFTGHDRVMAYRFLENGDGEVVAEACSPKTEPYLGLRYPAADIPLQVRQIMLRAPFRVIHDVRAEPVSLIQSADAPPLDMTLGHLRGVSPIHLEYLANMGVRSTMNASIIVRGKLWGLFAFHHNRPRLISAEARSVCELFGHFGSLLLQQEQESQKQRKISRSRSTIRAISLYPAVTNAVEVLAQDLQQCVDADGLALVRLSANQPTSRENDDTATHETPTSETVRASVDAYGDVPNHRLTIALCRQAASGIITNHCLAKSNASFSETELGKTAGAMVLPLDECTFLSFFRNAVLHQIRWAGSPEKEVTHGPYGPRLTPRASFQEYRESVSGESDRWESSDLTVGHEILRELWKLARTANSESVQNARELEKKTQFQDLLIAELNHRVRNTLALVKSIARQTQSPSISLEQYVELLERRITALSAASELATGTGDRWVSVGSLVRQELSPYEGSEDVVTASGPNVAVKAEFVHILALLLHEMATNAVKYGALSDSQGKLRVNWQQSAGGLEFTWQEQLATIPTTPPRHGFGWTLIRRAIPEECGGETSISLQDDRLVIRFWLPAQWVSSVSGEVSELQKLDASNQSNSDHSAHTPLSLQEFQSALILEDNVVLAMETERILREAGIREVHTVASVDRATQLMEEAKFDCALLDINVGNESSFEIAAKLRELGIVVIFCTGYTELLEYPPDFEAVPTLFKPVDRVKLIHTLKRAGQ